MRVVVVVLMLLTMVACGGERASDEAAGQHDSESSDLVSAVEGVCAARDEASESPEDAAATFLDRSHDGIHRLADRVATADRAVAAEVLEAKQAVEAAADELDPDALHRALASLAVSSGDALTSLNLDVPACAREEV